MEMDDPTEEPLEANWVFVEEVDTAEEAFGLNGSEEELFNETYTSQDIFKKSSKTNPKSFSHLDLNLDNQIAESLVESDGISIISTWSYSQCTPPEFGNSNDGINNVGLDEEQSHNGVDNQDEVENWSDHIYIQEVRENLGDQDGLEVAQNCDETAEVEKIPDSQINLNQKLLQESKVKFDLVDKLRSSDDHPLENIEGNNNENTLQYILSMTQQSMKKHCSASGFFIGTILIAVSSVFLGSYFSSPEIIQKELPTYQEKVFLYTVPGEENLKVPNALSFCLKKLEKLLDHKKYEKAMKEKIKLCEKQLEIKERYLPEKQGNLRKRAMQSNSRTAIYEINGNPKNNFCKNNLKGFKDSSKKIIYKSGPKIISKVLKLNRDKENKNSGKMNRRKMYEKIKDYKEHVNIPRNPKEKIYQKDQKKGYIKPENTFRDKGSKQRKIKVNKNNFEYSKLEPKKKKCKYYSTGKSSEVNKGTTLNLVFETKRSVRNSKHDCEGNKSKYNKKCQPNFLLVDQKNETIDGNWYMKLFKGRSELRNKDSSGDMYFDWKLDRENINRQLYLNL